MADLSSFADKVMAVKLEAAASSSECNRLQNDAIYKRYHIEVEISTSVSTRAGAKKTVSSEDLKAAVRNRAIPYAP
jgi:hypothetical protein